MLEDPVSTLLSLVDAHAICVGGVRAGGAWSLAFSPHEQIKFFAVAKGCCHIVVNGGPPRTLQKGDVFLFARPTPFVLTTDTRLVPREAHTVFAGFSSGIFDLGGDDFLFLGGHVDLAPTGGRLLTDMLPPAIHITTGCAEAERIRWLIHQMVEEYHAGLPGAGFACAGLTQLLFLHILRSYLAHGDAISPGVLRVLSDPRLAPAVRLMHTTPGHDWHLPELARAAAMSRTAFAERFRAAAGEAPLAYLTRWRMRLAERQLRENRQSLSEIARTLGYASDAAFSNAFKRITGQSPQRFRGTVRREPPEPVTKPTIA